MKIQIEPKVVARLAKRREKANWCFRSFLKNADMSGRRLDAIVHKHYAAVAKQIDCCTCGNCCREVLPAVHKSDLVRLAAGMALPEAEFTKRFLVPGEKKDAFTFNKKPCPFLSDNRCTAYDSRPDDCRSFPHLHKAGFVFRLMQGVENCSICPIVFNVFERLKDELWHNSDDVWEQDLDEA